jgi:hypothetical protein
LVYVGLIFVYVRRIFVTPGRPVADPVCVRQIEPAGLTVDLLAQRYRRLGQPADAGDRCPLVVVGCPRGQVDVRVDDAHHVSLVLDRLGRAVAPAGRPTRWLGAPDERRPAWRLARRRRARPIGPHRKIVFLLQPSLIR